MKIDYSKANIKGGENMYKYTTILGIIFTIAPFALGYSDNTAALWTSVIVGVGVTFVSVFEWLAEGKEKWEYWIIAVAGLLAITAPFLFNFAGSEYAFLLSFAFGIVFITSAIYKLLDKNINSAHI